MNNNKENKKIELALKKAKAKEIMTVNVIKHNKCFDKFANDMRNVLNVINNDTEKFKNQRELLMRNKLLERAVSSCLRFVEQNKLYFYMIDEESLEIEE